MGTNSDDRSNISCLSLEGVMQANDLVLPDIVETSPSRYCTCKEGKTLRAVFGKPDFDK
jgi:hypothetical protein